MLSVCLFVWLQISLFVFLFFLTAFLPVIVFLRLCFLYLTLFIYCLDSLFFIYVSVSLRVSLSLVLYRSLLVSLLTIYMLPFICPCHSFCLLVYRPLICLISIVSIYCDILHRLIQLISLCFGSKSANYKTTSV